MTMLHRVREKIGTAGLTVAIIALIAALGGTALAASGALTGKQKKEVEKIAKKYAGKDGAQGAAGSAGAKGDPGLEGAQGPEGKQGKEGKAGEAGKGVVIGTEPTGTGNCFQMGGTTVEKEGTPTSKKIVCNGKEGSPWTAGGTLPPGATEVGDWSFQVPTPKIKVDVEGTTKELIIGPTGEPESPIVVPISFPIPYAFNLKGSHVHYGAEGSGGAFVEGSGLCPGKILEPDAAPGELCVYQPVGAVGRTQETGIFVNGFALGLQGATTAGAWIGFESNTEPAYGYGSYAITGCTKTAQVPPNPAIECPADS
jgi:Collagen triple helix repeat (20 copies)